MNFSIITFGGVTLGDEAILSTGDWANQTEPQPVAALGLKTAWLPRIAGSQNLIWRPAFKIFILKASEFALEQSKINLSSYADGIKRVLLWKDRDAGTIRMRWPDAVMMNPEFSAADDPARSRYTESWVLRFITDQRPYAA